MATKKKKKKSEAIQLQELSNKAQITIQKLVNSANKQNMLFNAEEAEKARLFNSAEASTAREFNAVEAQKTRDFEKMMSDTSHQREVADLKAAGLNPVLSANSGAMSYTGASASASAATGPNASASLESGANSAASLVGSLMSGIVGLAQSKQSAAATKYAADQNLKAAKESAAAARYSADMAYRTVMDAPRDSAVSLIDKYFGQSAKEYFTDKNKRKGLYNILKEKTYNAAVNSYIVRDGLQRFGISLDRYNKSTQLKLRQQMLNTMIYGPHSSNANHRKKWNYAVKFLNTFKRNAR